MKKLAPAAAQDVKVRIGTGHDRGNHYGWRHRGANKVVVHRDRGHHYGWRNRNVGMSSKTVIKRGNGTTVIKKTYN